MRAIHLGLVGLLAGCGGSSDKGDTGTVGAGTDCPDPTDEPTEEVCDGVDNDCDGEIDEDANDQLSWYPDEDGDGYGDDTRAELACNKPDGDVAVGGDCDDTDTAFHPDADEGDCDDPNDYNCDGSTAYADQDDDGWAACDDCDDDDATRNPDAVEICDGVDDDCDGQTDGDSAVDATTWYQDADSDDYGDPSVSLDDCEQPEGYSRYDTDCDDGNADTWPGADELCDGADDDCDGAIDEGATTTIYEDADGDGFGTWDVSTESCTVTDGYSLDDTDCDDGDADVNPDALETCDGIDDDCDGDIDEADATDAATWYLDNDGDDHGDPSATKTACDAPDGYVASSDDCDDSDDARAPDVAEVCDDLDNDCDGDVDEDVLSTWYLDGDDDGWGRDDGSVTACTAPTSAYVDVGGDCNDASSSHHPDATLGCDGEDYDCDGEIDHDADGDGYPSDSCGGEDCDDSDPDLVPEPGGGCAMGESCDDILTRHPGSSSGSYTIDPDGPSTGVDPYDVTCDMVTDGGGWTVVGTWNREDDGDGTAELEALMTEEYNNMSRFTEATGYLQWSDHNATADALSYRLDIEVPNSGDVLFDYHVYAYSMDDSGLFFYVTSDSGATEHDLRCHDDITKSYYSSTEKALIPGYSCTYTTSSATFTWEEEDIDSFSSEVDAFYMRSLMYDTDGDYVRLYSFQVAVR